MKKFLLFILVFYCSFKENATPCPNENQTIIQEPLYPEPTIILGHSNWTKTHYWERIAEFKQNPLQTGDIVFIGNSITEQGGDWGSRFGDPMIKNRGISGDVTAGINIRLGEVIAAKPKQVFLLIGVNDLFQFYLSPEYVSDNIKAIILKIKNGSPTTKIYVQSIFPTSIVAVNDKIDTTNALIKKMARSEWFTYIDITESLKNNTNGKIKASLTTDGTHLNENGYAVWKNILLPYMKISHKITFK